MLIYDGSLIPNQRLRDLTIATAKAENLPLQFSSMPGGGTDAGRMQLTGGGAPCIVLGVPCRYIHSHAGIIHSDDYDNLVKLLIALLKRLDAKTVADLV